MTVKKAIRGYMLTGTIVLVPVSLTLWLIFAIAGFLVRVLHLGILPTSLAYRLPIPDLLRGPLAWLFDIGNFIIGFTLTLALIILVGALVRTFLGRKLMSFWEGIIERIPFFRGIYSAAKQLTEAIFLAHKRKFARVVLVEYPRKDVYAVGFVTGATPSEITDHFPGQKLINIFIPSTPNPTTGYYLVVREEETIPVEMTTEAAFGLIISGGLSSNETNNLVNGRKPEEKGSD